MKIKSLVVALATLSAVSITSAYATTASNASASKSTVTNNNRGTSAASSPATVKPELQNNDTNGTPAIQKDQAYIQRQLAVMNQNEGNPVGPWNWYKHIHLGGLINVDASHWSKPNFGQGSGDTTASSYITLSTAKLNVDADFGDWVSAHIGFLYTNGSSPSVVNYSQVINYNRRVNVQQAYATIANFNKSPFYLRAGQELLPFGRYHLYPITQSLTQILSQTDLPTVQGGFITKMGVYAAVYAASGENKVNQSGTQINAYGGELGYEDFTHPVGYDVGVGYLNNMAQVDAIREIAKNNNGYTRSVGGLSVYGNLYAGPFGFGVRYVTALRRFSATDYQYTDHGTTKGARPSAAGLSADYNFKTWGHNSRIGIGYQWSSEAHNTAANVALDNVTRLPKNRWLVGYGVNLIRHVALGLQFYQDQDYGKNYGGTNKKNDVVTARISFLF